MRVRLVYLFTFLLACETYMRWQYNVVAASIGVLLLVLGACSLIPTNWIGATRDSSGRPTVVKIGELAPEINLQSMTGDLIVLSQFVGHPVLVNFWARWCDPCRAEFPTLVRKYKQYQDQGFVIIGVNTGDDNPDEGLLVFMRNTLVTFPIVRDRDGRIARMYNIKGLPTSVFIDRTGIARDIFVGGPMEDEFIDQKFAQINK